MMIWKMVFIACILFSKYAFKNVHNLIICSDSRTNMGQTMPWSFSPCEAIMNMSCRLFPRPIFSTYFVKSFFFFIWLSEQSLEVRRYYSIFCRRDIDHHFFSLLFIGILSYKSFSLKGDTCTINGVENKLGKTGNILICNYIIYIQMVTKYLCLIAVRQILS